MQRYTSGEVRCWGSNLHGQLGDGTSATRRVPVTAVLPSSAVEIVASNNHTCALLTNGHLFCWGFNSSGQLGDGSMLSRSRPTRVVGIEAATAVAVGAEHSCALTSDGRGMCWGRNSSGELGDGTTGMSRPLPAPVLGLSDAFALAAGSSHSCAARVDGMSLCWGRNEHGQLGNGEASFYDQPRPVAGTPFPVSMFGDGFEDY